MVDTNGGLKKEIRDSIDRAIRRGDGREKILGKAWLLTGSTESAAYKAIATYLESKN